MAGVGKRESRLRRKKRVRKKIRGTPERPRLCVFRSSRHIYGQLIEDSNGKTLAAVSSLSKSLSAEIGNNGGNKEGAAIVGNALAEQAVNLGVKKVVFDRNGFLYHGRVKAFSEAARNGGLEF